jgi:uncharacterized protein
MRLYEGDISNFKQDVLSNTIADKIANKFEEIYKRKAPKSEYRAWNSSMNFVKNIIDSSSLEDNMIAVEYELPYSEKRIDVLLFGNDKNGNDNVVLIELKQWSNESVSDSGDDGTVKVDFGKFVKEVPHPSLQAEGYYWYLKDFMMIFHEEPYMSLAACVYCHNYTKGKNEILYHPKFKESLKIYPLFSKEDTIELGNYIKEKIGKGKGLEVFGKFIHSILKPSKKLLDHTGDMINKQQIFHLIDEQITAYKTIMSKAKNISKTKEKSVIIIKGGPGTGKSVIALEVMGELLRNGHNVVHATGSSAFTNTLRKILGVRAASQFKFFNSFIDKTKYKENGIDVLICDEAHRIRKSSESRYTPGYLRTGKPQIDELIRSSKLSIFFIDEHQIVRPSEIGSINLIKESAGRFGAKVYELVELQTQFRCGGSGKYLKWIEDILMMREEGQEIELGEDSKMGFTVVNSPHELKRVIDEKNKEKKNCARIVAGFCWSWSKPRHDGTLVNDVKIGNFEMPWENKDQFWKWAIDDSGMEQVGTVYTSQGFEFDYIGVIFGNDLVWDTQAKKWVARKENSCDGMVTRNNEKLEDHLKNVYRVLLSRAHKGVYVYFMDDSTRKYFESRIEKNER